ncbi:hypothetical protein FAGKG844_10313 [Frankia sp. AgKG'84/4]
MTVSVVDTGARQISRSAVVNAAAEELFALVADPHRHSEIDGSHTVRGTVSGPARLSAGARFSMNMKAYGLPYRITSRVTAFEEPRLLKNLLRYRVGKDLGGERARRRPGPPRTPHGRRTARRGLLTSFAELLPWSHPALAQDSIRIPPGLNLRGCADVSEPRTRTAALCATDGSEARVSEREGVESCATMRNGRSRSSSNVRRSGFCGAP